MCFHKPFELLSSVYFVALRAVTELYLHITCFLTVFYREEGMKVKGCTAQEEHLHIRIETIYRTEGFCKYPFNRPNETQAKHNHKLYHNKPLNMDYGETTLRFFLSRSLWCLILGCSVTESESSHTQL